ncbi:unnamed protein product, partial [Rotaria magnacalcarata]
TSALNELVRRTL